MSNNDRLSEHLTWPKYLEYIHHSVKQNDVIPNDRTEDGFFAWIVDRKDVQKKIDLWLTVLNDSKNVHVKDNDKAKSLREEGNQLFKSKKFPMSIVTYTQSARYAKFGRGDFSMAIANRSAAFFHTCNYKESIQDIELAIDCGYPAESAWKLQLRAAKCHLKLRQGKLAEEVLTKLKIATENSSEITEAIKETVLKQVAELSTVATESQARYETFPASPVKNMEESLQKMISKNSSFPFASSDVILKESSERGRHVVAAKSLKKGHVLFIEKPFAWVPVTHGNDVTLCAHCCGDLEGAPFPCRGCMEALYCCVTCWKESWKYHQWECPGYHFGLWQQIGVSHLAFKIFLVSVTTSDKIWFNDVQKLKTNVDVRQIDDVFGIAIAALMVTTYIEKYTNFLDSIDLKSCHVDKFTEPSLKFDFDVTTKKGKKMYIGSLILRHSLQMLANAYALSRHVEPVVDHNQSSDIMSIKQVRIAAGAYPSSSMMNHSCDPDVIHTFWKNWIIIKAVKDIPEGQEIHNCYGPYFKRMQKAQRQMDLLSQYCFFCQCTACTNPLFDCYTHRFDGLKCPDCSGSAFYLSGCETQRCLDCGKTNHVTCQNQLEMANQLYAESIHLTDIDKWQEALPNLEKCLAIREKYLYKHNEDVAITLDAIAKTHGSMKNWSKSISYLEQSLEAVEERYGADSIEIGNELLKITDVGMHFLHQPSSKKKGGYKRIFEKTKKQVERAMDIFDLNGLPFDEKYLEMSNRKDELCEMMKHFRV